MKKLILFSMTAALISLGGYASAWGFSSGSTGADGALNPSTNTVVQLPASGVLNYTTVNIPSGVTVTFQKNASNTPVTILTTGDVTVTGTISVNGSDAVSITPGAGGPGGSDGGSGGTFNVAGGKGAGPGGGNAGSVSTNTGYASGAGGGGGFGSSGAAGTNGSTYGIGGSGGGTYGNISIVPLLGGSGGGGGAGSAVTTYQNVGGAGGGGGGALLIASSGTINVTGTVTAKGGVGAGSSTYAAGGGGGSGGTIKLMANTIAGNGTISAIGNYGGSGSATGGTGGDGRIRFEANSVTRTSATTPAYTYNYPGNVFVSNMPTLQITSIGGVNVPASPTGKYASPDVTLPSSTTNPITVNISATNIPVGTQVTLTAVPQYGTATNVTSTGLTGNDASSTTTSVSLTLSTSYQSILQAQATFTLLTAMYWEGEKIEKVRVASTMGKGSETVYITEAGREIKAELIAGLMR